MSPRNSNSFSETTTTEESLVQPAQVGRTRRIFVRARVFLAVVADDQRFEYPVRRDALVEQVAKRIASEPDSQD